MEHVQSRADFCGLLVEAGALRFRRLETLGAPHRRKDALTHHSEAGQSISLILGNAIFLYSKANIVVLVIALCIDVSHFHSQ